MLFFISNLSSLSQPSPLSLNPEPLVFFLNRSSKALGLAFFPSAFFRFFFRVLASDLAYRISFLIRFFFVRCQVESLRAFCGFFFASLLPDPMSQCARIRIFQQVCFFFTLFAIPDASRIFYSVPPLGPRSGSFVIRRLSPHLLRSLSAFQELRGPFDLFSFLERSLFFHSFYPSASSLFRPLPSGPKKSPLFPRFASRPSR